MIDADFLSCFYMIYNFVQCCFLCSESRGNYCFKNIKLLLIAPSLLNNLPLLVVSIVLCGEAGDFLRLSVFTEKEQVQSSK